MPPLPMPPAGKNAPWRWSHRALAQALNAALPGGIESFVKDDINYLSGNLWTSRQRQAHSLHEISYRACFKPQLPQFFLSLLTRQNDIVLDPFLGRGTTAIQSALMGRIACGSDINPLSVILTCPRLSPPSITAVQKRLDDIAAAAPPAAAATKEEARDLEVFFHPQTLKQLITLKTWFAKRARARQADNIDQWIKMVAINRLTGHSPGFFSVKTMPPNQAVSAAVQKQLNSKSGLQPQPKDVAALIMKKSRSLLKDGGGNTTAALGNNGGSPHQLHCAAADNLSYLKKASVNAIITSPPFLDTVDYLKDNWLRCWFANIAPHGIRIAAHKNPADWTAFIRRCFIEFARVVKPGGAVAFEVGDVRGGKILLEKLVLQAVKDLPFFLIAVLINRQHFTKTANCWGVSNNTKGTNTNRIVLLEKTP